MPEIIRNHPDEDDFILLGDFNDSAKTNSNRFRWLENQLPLVRSNMVNESSQWPLD